MADDLVPITALIEESESHLLALGERPQLISAEPRAEHLLPCALLE